MGTCWYCRSATCAVLSHPNQASVLHPGQADADSAARGDQGTVAQLQLQLREVSTRAAAAQRQADRKTDLAARQDALSAEAAAARSELQVIPGCPPGLHPPRT